MMALDFIDVFYGGREFDNFGAKLFQLIAKADYVNKARLQIVFPVHIELYEWWLREKEMPTRAQVEAKAKLLEDGYRDEIEEARRIFGSWEDPET